MILNQVHPLTLQVLGEQAQLLSSAFEAEIESGDPAYFAPFLRSRGKQGLLEEWIGELASWEWALHHADQNQDHQAMAAQATTNQTVMDRGHWVCSESLSIVMLKWDVLEWLKTRQSPPRRERLFKVWYDRKHLRPAAEEISLNEAYVLEALKEGPLSHEQLVLLLTSRGADMGLLEELLQRGVLKRIAERKFDL